MASFRLLMVFFAAVSMGWSPAVAEETTALSGAISGTVRDKRHHREKKLCRKYGICGGYGGFQGGHQGFQGGYQHQGGYPVPPINIAISQSQASANEGGGGHAHGYYPNNYQYNGFPPHQGGFPNKGGYVGHGGYPNQGGFGSGYFGNGHGAYNNQFNGNYYGPIGGPGGPGGPGGHLGSGPQGGGYGFQRPFGPYFDESHGEEGNKPEHSESEEGPNEGPNGPGYNDYQGQGAGFNQGGFQGQGHEHGQENYSVAGAFALTARKNQ